MIVHLSGVTLTASERSEEDWEEVAATKRASAAKLAQLAALELQQISASAVELPVPAASTRKTGWPIVSYLSTFVLNKLELSVSDVSLSFMVRA